MKNIDKEIFQKRDVNPMRHLSAVLLNVPEKKNDIFLVTIILHSVKMYCAVSKVQRLGKLLFPGSKSAAFSVAGELDSDSQS